MIRGVGLRAATAINVCSMVGAGPFITLPLVVTALHGSISAIAWIAGALIALCDGLVWAELGSRYPRAGGTYAYLRSAFGGGLGRLAAFLFVWQFLFFAPLVLASGYIGFAQYAAYLAPALAAPVPAHLVAAAVGVVTLAALYRAIPQIARGALVLGAVALVTLLAVAIAGLTHPRGAVLPALAATLDPRVGVAALGAALVITLYDYAGYGDVCALGEEVLDARRVLPRSIVLAVLAVGAAYVLLNAGAVSALSPREIAGSTSVASLIAARTLGGAFAAVMTVAVLLTAFGSTYALLLAAARVPFAAARDGDFLAPFAVLHPRGRFPHVALVTIGLLALPCSLLSLDAVIAALTAGIVLVQNVGQIAALAVARAREGAAPFRIPLYPLPPLVALGGWLFLFSQTGAKAILFGVLTLAAGAAVFFGRAALSRTWPFAGAAAVAAFFACAPLPAAADVTWGHAALSTWDGEPALLVDGRPFFFWGGAFFYERLPASRWHRAMLDMRALGANTLDLYVPWNWHELADGDFDFDGHTNPRRNLREVLRLARELNFRLIVRPGPVIRNEWRNGGYPAWLLERPEYGMPLHDVLEGRYPATATLQNAHSDDAAAEWMRNATHLRYASRWLHRVLREFAPVADRVIAVQLDDDQGAYLDNQTYPAPHFQAYLHWLDAQVRDVVGPVTPTFINTYQMRVPASSPVWTMGNWYQSEAYELGEHDRSELDVSTAMLRTNRRGPLAQSEFQAGWLAAPEDPLPRPAAPENTTLALYDLLSWGVKGIVDFPMQDTLAPFGWEAPFSNALYAWDAAYANPWSPASIYEDEPRDDYLKNRRWSPTAAFGSDVARYGPLLAETHRAAFTAIAYPSAARQGGADFGLGFSRFRTFLAQCAIAGSSCDVIDLAAAPIAARYRELVLSDPGDADRFASAIAAFRRHGGRLAASPSPSPWPGALLLGRDASFLIIQNWSAIRRSSGGRPIVAEGRRLALPSITVRAHDAVIVPLDLRLHRLDARFDPSARLTTACTLLVQPRYFSLFPQAGLCTAWGTIGRRLFSVALQGDARMFRFDGSGARAEDLKADVGTTFEGHTMLFDYGTRSAPLSPHAYATFANLRDVPAGSALAYESDVFEDGAPAVVLDNRLLRVVTVTEGGARVPVVELLDPQITAMERQMSYVPDNLTDATGALRDDVLVQPPPSTTDRIGRWTRSYPAGMFNRSYSATIEQSGARARVRLVYHAPDTVPAGGTFERLLTLDQGAARLIVDERYIADAAPGADAQRLVSLSSLSLDWYEPTHVFAPPAPVGAVASSSAPPALPPYVLDPHASLVRILPLYRGRFLVTAVTWRAGDVEDARLEPHRSNATLRLQLAPGWRRFTFSVHVASSVEAAHDAVEAERAWLEANPGPVAR
ncbi:MAG: amino acid permease [Candidatus Eremiobacteraeota bacterium]|nr:amino acid permease [Candidatus Eremiobacteraeota bacterium]